jgi:hypothetical protein
MKTLKKLRTGQIRLALLIIMILILGGTNAVFPADFSEAEKILGTPGKTREGAVVFSFPRSDTKVTIDGEPIPTSLGFGSWTAWKDLGSDSMVMGDLVLLEKEINPVISALAETNIRVTALHNHFLHEEPRIMYMNIHGMGPTETLARGIRKALDNTATPRPQSSATVPQPVLTLNSKRIEEIIGHSGQVMGTVFKITLGRPGVKMGGVELTASMGLNTWAGFVGTNEHGHVAGDVAMTAQEVNKVIQALRKGAVGIVAVHNHMLDEDPRIFFLHYWGIGSVESLANTVRQAFDRAKGPVQ